MPTTITSKHIEIDANSNKVLFKGEGGEALRNSLIQKHAETFSEISALGAVVRPGDISIDKSGNVVIDNASLKNSIENIMKNAQPGKEARFLDTNCSCGKP